MNEQAENPGERTVSVPRAQLPNAIQAAAHADLADAQGRYRIKSIAGRGGMGQVMIVEDTVLERILAMKILGDRFKEDPAILRTFFDEARITAQLQHPNIIPVHDLGEIASSGQPFYTMKLIDGVSLGDIIAKLKVKDPEVMAKYPQGALLTIFRKVCDAIAYAHSRGIIHRDIKPANIMIGPFGEVLVLDWGLAKKADAAAAPMGRVHDFHAGDGDAQMTMEGTIKGSLAYISPEQAMGDISKIDRQTDVFLLGATLYHLLALQPPYPQKTLDEILGKAEKGDFMHPQDTPSGHNIPNALASIVLRAMAPIKADRFKSVAEFIACLDSYLSGRNLSTLRKLRRGEVLIRDGEYGDETYIVVSGRIEVSREVDGRPTTLDFCGRGAVLGELATLTHDQRNATAVAVEPSEVMAINRQIMFDELRKLPPWLERIVLSMARKVSGMNERIHPLLVGSAAAAVIKQFDLLLKVAREPVHRDRLYSEAAENIAIPLDKSIEIGIILEEESILHADGSRRISTVWPDALQQLLSYSRRQQRIAKGLAPSSGKEEFFEIAKVPALEGAWKRLEKL
ncbi:MAG: hypothetical protein RL095_2352 [Verrucomicrobiota bacterium]|jgi:serine/threonine-protein kinase